MKWFVLALLLVVTSVNYLDRLLLSVLAPVLRDQFHFSEQLYGNVNAAFQICYAVGFLISGALIDRYGLKRGLAVGAAVWSVVSAMHASVTSAAQFGLWRALLGFSEAVNFPACNKAVAEWFPVEQRALATGIFNAGPNLAAVVGPPLFVAVTAAFGWRTCFVAVSLTGLLWAGAWWLLYRGRETPQTARTARAIGFKEAFSYRQTRGYAISKVLVDPAWYFLLFWLPLYLRDARGLEMSQIGWALPCIYFASGTGSVTAGWLSGFLLHQGCSRRTARLGTLSVCAVIMPLALASAMTGSLTRTIAMFSLAAAAGAEHRDREPTRRLAAAGGAHALFAEHGRLAGQGAEFARHHRGDVAAGQAFLQERSRHMRQLGPGARQRAGVAGVLDLVAERDRLAGAQLEQVARRQRAHDGPGVIGDAEMADLEAAHAADGAVHECVGRHGGGRLRHEGFDRLREGRFAAFRQGAQEVAFGHDTGVGRRMGVVTAAGVHIERGDLQPHQAGESVAYADAAVDVFGRRTHDVVHLVPIGVAVDAPQGAFGVVAGRRFHGLDPAGAVVLVEDVGERPAGALGLREGADAAFAQPRQQRQEDARAGEGVAAGRVPVGDLDIEPRGEAFQRVAGEIGLGDLGEQAGVETARPLPGEPGAFALAPHHREIEADGVADHDGVACVGAELRPHGGEIGGVGDRHIVEAMDAGRGGRDRLAGLDQSPE